VSDFSHFYGLGADSVTNVTVVLLLKICEIIYID